MTLLGVMRSEAGIFFVAAMGAHGNATKGGGDGIRAEV
jgi:hypothetical protein